MELVIRNGLRFSKKNYMGKGGGEIFLTRQKNFICLTCICSGHNRQPVTDGATKCCKVRFAFHLDYLGGYSTPNANMPGNLFTHGGRRSLCRRSLRLMQEIIHCPFSGMLRIIFLESKALELLVCFMEKGTAAKPATRKGYWTKPAEEEKIIKAEKIILSSLSKPPSIKQLCHAVGTNREYLIKGFKEKYGMTISDYVIMRRMEKAKTLLTTTNLSVAAVAEETGYSAAGNFIRAFKKYTGMLPGDFRRGK